MLHNSNSSIVAVNPYAFYIRKEAGKRKDAFRALNEESIPDFLRQSGTVTFDGNEFHLVCVEGRETAHPGDVIAWEESASTGTGWNTWVVGNVETSLVEKDGVFYKKAPVLQAALVGNDLPRFLRGAKVARNEDASWSVFTDWGEAKGFPGKSVWVLYGTKDDGSPDANLLTLTEKSAKEYYVCDEGGTIIGPLVDLVQAD